MQVTQQVHVAKPLQFTVKINVKLAKFSNVITNLPFSCISRDNFGIFKEKASENRLNLVNALTYDKQFITALSFGFNLFD